MKKPVSNFITGFLEYANLQHNLIFELIDYIKSTLQLEIKVADFELIKLPPYLCFHFCLLILFRNCSK
jgi:hypothetical protein